MRGAGNPRAKSVVEGERLVNRFRVSVTGLPEFNPLHTIIASKSATSFFEGTWKDCRRGSSRTAEVLINWGASTSLEPDGTHPAGIAGIPKLVFGCPTEPFAQGGTQQSGSQRVIYEQTYEN
jgi:hypothetical protein